MEGTMNNTTTLTAPSNAVDDLMKEAADEAGIELDLNLPSGITSAISPAQPSVSADEQGLSDRLARLRQGWGLRRIIWDDVVHILAEKSIY